MHFDFSKLFIVFVINNMVTVMEFFRAICQIMGFYIFCLIFDKFLYQLWRIVHSLDVKNWIIYNFSSSLYMPKNLWFLSSYIFWSATWLKLLCSIYANIIPPIYYIILRIYPHLYIAYILYIYWTDEAQCCIL